MGLILKVIPIWAYALVGLLLWGGYGHIKADRLQKKIITANAEAQLEAVYIRDKKQDTVRTNEVDYAKKLRAVAKSADVLRANNNELQQLVARYRDTANDAIAICGVDGERGRILEKLLGESAELAEEGARRVESLGSKTTALQKHISSVCVSK